MPRVTLSGDYAIIEIFLSWFYFEILLFTENTAVYIFVYELFLISYIICGGSFPRTWITGSKDMQTRGSQTLEFHRPRNIKSNNNKKNDQNRVVCTFFCQVSTLKKKNK